MQRVRVASPGDAEAIHAVMQAAFEPFREQYTPDCFDATVLDPGRIQERMEAGPIFIMESEGEIVGSVGVVAEDRSVYVRGMAVHPDARRQGVGRRLLVAAQGYAHEVGARRLWLSTTPFLQGSIALYRAFGFEPTDGPPDLHSTPLVSFEMTL